MLHSPLWLRAITITIVTGSLLCNGCRTIPPAPIDWSEEAAAWHNSSTNFPHLTLETARQAALIFNPEINAARLAAQSAQRQVASAGWWEDPTLDLDALRLLGGGLHPWLLGAGLSFSLPLNGVPGLEKEAARSYAAADAWALIQAEQELLATLDELWLALATDRLCAAAQHDYLELLAHHEADAAALVKAGELPRDALERLRQERLQLQLACPCCGPRAVVRRQELLRTIGLHPAAPVTLALDTPLEFDTTDREQPQAELDLVRHPLVQEQLTRHAASEVELRAELRKQYPDIELGPLFEREEGETRGGLALGLRLPLWNRNRSAIASAAAGRDTARLAAVTAWRSLVTTWHTAQQRHLVALQQEEQLRTLLLPATLEAATRTRRLFAAGEADLSTLLETEATLYAARDALIDAQKSRYEAQIELNRFALPPAFPLGTENMSP